jgi:2-iminoacetate synthase
MSGMPALKLSESAVDFIDEPYINGLLRGKKPDSARVREIITKSLAKQALSVAETSELLLADSPELIEEIFAAARELKKNVYGNRIVLFAPLYIGNECVNDCKYCAFKRSNTYAVRRTLNQNEIRQQVEALENKGHKRLILVFGEHRAYDAEFIANSVRTVYETKVGHGEIRRVNINAAPLDHEGYAMVKAAGIGTYQIFHETYHHDTYARFHPQNTRKGNYMYRLDGLSRAFEAGCDDVGLGVLFGLYDWKFEVLSLVTHALYLQDRYNVGPHTISFPRLRPAAGVDIDENLLVNDDEFKRIIAILRLAVPYTGLILTARENPQVRRECMSFGVSQIDAGSRIELGGYTEAGDAQVMEREQFSLGDVRSLDEVMKELMTDGYVPSFCTSCYRVGRTGEHFMEFSIPGFIKEFCTPNALLTLEEYLVDYATQETRIVGESLIADELSKMADGDTKDSLIKRLQSIKEDRERDLYF